MGIASELQQMAANKAAIKASIESKDPDVPPTDDMSQWPAAIASIPTGGGGGGNIFVSAPAYGVLVDGVKSEAGRFYENVTEIELNKGIESYFSAKGYLSDGAVIDYSEETSTVKIPLNGRSAVIYMYNQQCFLSGTQVLLANGSEKKVEDVAYDDLLVTWDFENGTLSSAKPLWIKKMEVVGYYFENVFADGTVLLTTGKSATGWGHRGYNLTRGSFTYFPASVGDEFLVGGRSVKLVKSELIEAAVKSYNITTAGHMNLYANGVLTSCSLNNYREFDASGLRFKQGVRHFHTRDDFAGIPDAYIHGLHLLEQQADVESLRRYVGNLIASRDAEKTMAKRSER